MFFGECLCLLPVLIRIIYQTYFKSSTISSKPSTSRRNTSDLDSEPLLAKSTPSSEPNGNGNVNGRVSISEDEARSTGQSNSSPTLPRTSTSNGNSQSATRERPRGRGRTKSYGKPKESKALKGKAIFLFFTPALCDICGTTLMNVGLLFTPVSIYQ